MSDELLYGRSPAMEVLPLIQADNLVKQAELIVQEILDAFVPTTKAQFRLTQGQGSASIRAREWLERQRRARAATVESKSSE
jgi:hypothetical protein